jgi:hypothetical protein
MFSAFRRWVRPASMVAHSSPGMIRGQEIGGDDPLGGALGAVDGEGDPLQQEEPLQRPLPPRQFGGSQGRHPGVQRIVVRSHLAARREHFIIGNAGQVGRLGHRQGGSL